MNNGTGALYPTIEIGGVSYELRISREVLLYRLSRKGISLADLRGRRASRRCMTCCTPSSRTNIWAAWRIWSLRFRAKTNSSCSM